MRLEGSMSRKMVEALMRAHIGPQGGDGPTSKCQTPRQRCPPSGLAIGRCVNASKAVTNTRKNGEGWIVADERLKHFDISCVEGVVNKDNIGFEKTRKPSRVGQV